MSNIVFTFSNLSMAFADRPLFSSLSASMSRNVSGLTGKNGQGKSVLLKILAGQLTPTAGAVKWFSPYYYVEQKQRLSQLRIADVLGVAELYDCFNRIEQGYASTDDLEKVASLWHLPASWRQLLDSAGIDRSLADKVSCLSGGQQTRLALCSAFIHSERYLLLDEPTNHLDRAGRRWLAACLKNHAGGALVVSHDVALLRQVSTLFELDYRGLMEYGGNYDLYAKQKQEQIKSVARKIDALTKEIRRDRQQKQETLAKAQQRRKQGEKLRQSGSQSKLLLDAKKNRAQQSAAKLENKYSQKRDRLTDELQQNQRRLEKTQHQRLTLSTQGLRGGLRLYLNDLILPWSIRPPLSLSLYSGERLHVTGHNGAGKSTLLKVISGVIKSESGICQVHGSCAYLDQHFSFLKDELSAVDNLHELHPEISLSDWRTRLSAMRLKGDKALLAVATLSGGERLKVALLAITGGHYAPNLLLLDEPENHLDLDSKQLLIQALQNYPGTLVIISHDEEFVKDIGVNQTLAL